MIFWKQIQNFFSQDGVYLSGKNIVDDFVIRGILTKEHLSDLALNSLPAWATKDLKERILLIQSVDYLEEIIAAFQKSDSDCSVESIIVVVNESILKLPTWDASFSILKKISSIKNILKHPHVSQLKCTISKYFYDAIYQEIPWHLDGRQDGTAVIHPTAKVSQQVFIGAHARIGEGVFIFPGAVIGPYCVIEKASVIYPNVTIYPFSKLGAYVRVHGGAVIGSDGFGYEFNGKQHEKIWHFGGVYIEDFVEIGANSCIDSGTFYPTVIKSGVKIDNQVQIAHNTLVEEHVVLCGQSGTAGSSKIGAYTVMGGRAALGPQCELGKQCQIAGNAMITKSWPDKSILGGHPARPLDEWMRGVAYLKKLIKK